LFLFSISRLDTHCRRRKLFFLLLLYHVFNCKIPPQVIVKEK
jgi:hypothetical protein